MHVVLTPEAREDAARLPATMQIRLRGILVRLQSWPNVSGAKALRFAWRGHYRIRMGDWRVVFKIVEPDVIVVRIAHRKDVYYED
jgi:mRNA-degrading endonuclease RelE of RelBE toxin-antitoxin system